MSSQIISQIRNLILIYFSLFCFFTHAQNQDNFKDYKNKMEMLFTRKTDSLIRISSHLIDLKLQDSLRQMNKMALEKELSNNKTRVYLNAKQRKLSLNANYVQFQEHLDENFSRIMEIQDSIDNTLKQLELGWQFNSVITYRGRIFGDGDVGNNLWCHFKLFKGFTFLANGYYWPGAERKWAKTDFGIEYETKIFKNLSLILGYERWFFNVSDKASRADINNFTEIYLSYDLNYFSINSGTYYMFGNAKSWQTDLEISSYFEWYRKLGADKIFIEPSYRATWGTQFVSVGYYSTNPRIDDNFFGIMAHQLSAKITYQFKSFRFSPEFYYIHPVNGTMQDPVKDFFYVSSSIYYTIKFRK